MEENRVTTIKLSKETKLRLEKLKSGKRESYDELIKNILDILSLCRINPLKARSKLMLIDRIKRNFISK